MTEPIKPALTAEEWLIALKQREQFGPPSIGHREAALALYGQPFGFTREDVKALRDEWDSEWHGVSQPNAGDALLSIADRIEALLPPEK